MTCLNEECDKAAKHSCCDCGKDFCDTCVTDCGWADVKGARCDEKICYICRDRSKHGICKRCGKDKIAKKAGMGLT